MHAGIIDPIVTQANIRSTICKAGWTDPHLRPPESQTEWFKRYRAFPAYGLTWYRESELDHLVPLELGGSNDATNLWPELGKPSGNPKDRWRTRCTGRVLGPGVAGPGSDSHRINWMTAVKRLGLGPAAPGGAARSQPWCTASASPANDGYLATTTCTSAPTSLTATPRHLTRATPGPTRPTALAQRLCTCGISRPARASR